MKAKTGLIGGTGEVVFAALLASATSYAAPSSSSTMNVTLNPTLALSILPTQVATSEIDELTIEVTPNGALHTNNLFARVSTNSAPGYKLMLEMEGASTDLEEVTDSSKIIPGTTTDNVTAATMPMNSWGYSIDATNFSKVPANGSAVAIATGSQTTTSQNPAAYEDIEVTFGVKVNTTGVAFGTYSNTVVFTVVVNE